MEYNSRIENLRLPEIRHLPAVSVGMRLTETRGAGRKQTTLAQKGTPEAASAQDPVGLIALRTTKTELLS
jgi:hypothetical protein